MTSLTEDTPQTAHAPRLALSSREDAAAFVERVKAAGFEQLRFETPDMAGLSGARRSRSITSPATCAPASISTAARSPSTPGRCRSRIPATTRR